MRRSGPFEAALSTAITAKELTPENVSQPMAPLTEFEEIEEDERIERDERLIAAEGG